MKRVRSTIRDMGYGRGHVGLCMFVYAGKGRSPNPPFTHGQSRLRGVTLCGLKRVYLLSQMMQQNRSLTSVPWYFFPDIILCSNFTQTHYDFSLNVFPFLSLNPIIVTSRQEIS